MFLGIIQSFFAAFGMILTKLVVENKIVGNNIQTLISRVTHIVLLFIIISIGFFDTMYYVVPKGFIFTDYLLLLVGTLGLYYTYYLRRTAYANEKVSRLQPFAMLFQVFPVIFSFIFIASERINIITFTMALAASFIVIIPSIDFKNFKINKYCLMVLTSSSIKSVQLFIVIYLLQKFNPVSFYITESLIIIAFALFFMLMKSELWEYKKINKKYSLLLMSANSISIIAIILSLTMFKELGVIITSLLSLLYLFFVYILGYFILKEKPTHKDILISLGVAICIIIWIYFKQ